MTMGPCMKGHASLIRAARERDDEVTVTIFVNPMQFGAGEDLDRYPRTLQADLELCENLGVDTVYTPAVADVYRRPPLVTINPGVLGTELRCRPARHFEGMLTVVFKLLQLTRPHDAFFGEKDYQQLTLIRSMAMDLDLDVDIVGCRPRAKPTAWRVRAATSTCRPERAQAAAIPRALQAAAHETDADTIAAVAAEHLAVWMSTTRWSGPRRWDPCSPVRADCWSLRASDRPACSTIAR